MPPVFPSSPERRQAAWLRPVGFLLVAAVTVGIWWTFREQLTLDALAQHEAALRTFQREHSLAMCVSAFVVYVLVTALSIPAAAALTLAVGWLFGFARGLPLASCASTAGATIAFLMSRHLLRDYVRERFAHWVPRVTETLARDGALYLFALRLTPAVPFFVVNTVMGLTQVPTRTFWWVSQLGMLPATCVLVYAGSSFPDLQQLATRGPRALITLPLATAFVLLGLFPFAIKWAMSRFTRQH